MTSALTPRSPPEAKPQILYFDAFDSFTNNIIGLLEKQINANVTLVRIDDQSVANDLKSTLSRFDAVVVGPGPGHPQIADDVGFIPKLWQLQKQDILPIFGICLGFQSLSSSYGAEVKRLLQPRHGIVSRPEHRGSDIFTGIGDLEATQYHSLCVDLGNGKEYASWAPTETCPQLQPLAWDLSDQSNGPILMGVRHVEKPFWGVQFHPESICTSEAGRHVVGNWWTHARDWLQVHGRVSTSGYFEQDLKTPAPASTAEAISSTKISKESPLASTLSSLIGGGEIHLRFGTHHVSSLDAAELVEILGYNKEEIILLDSQGHKSGRYSILGVPTPEKTLKLTYSVSEKLLHYGVSEGNTYTEQLDTIDQVWPLLQEALDLHDPRKQAHSTRGSSSYVPDASPFWGGFIGYISYEAGLETIDVPLTEGTAQGNLPDVNFAFFHRSIVIDHDTSLVYCQSLLPDDWPWILENGHVLDRSMPQKDPRPQNLPTPDASRPSSPSSAPLHDPTKADLEKKALEATLSVTTVSRPDEHEYRQKVLRCQDYLASGDSYELCLTDRSEINVPVGPEGAALTEWALYKRLRKNNPAPFGCFLRLGLQGSSETVVVGSSPERFLRWTRDGKCQFRPIKGTVKKGRHMSREQAHEILNSSKERAENLMIVDLIRHDLSGVIGAQNTWVTKLMVVEEYETVYQLVSVIEGQMPVESATPARGMHVLKSSLPPGSMTGAPKKRSCEILQGIERQPRGIYSGVLGYMDVGGAGDFSVVIRTAVKAEAPSAKTSSREGSSTGAVSEMSQEEVQTYRVGAGGAVTIQSTDLGEFLEMETKASSVLGALCRRSDVGIRSYIGQ